MRGGNLFLRQTSNGVERVLTSDGTEQTFYARALPNPSVMRHGKELFAEQPADVAWSADSTRIATFRIDTANTGTLTLTQSTPPHGHRPRAVTYHYPLSGDDSVPLATGHVFHISDGRRVDLHVDPVPILYYYGLEFQWRADSRHVVMEVSNRGWSTLRVIEANGDSGVVHDVVVERSNTFVASHRNKWTLVNDWGQYVWAGDVDGWPHLQLIDAVSGRKLRQLTHGAWSVTSVPYVDAAAGTIFFVATGREPGRDPYLRHLYRIARGGGELRLLTPEPMDHETHLSSDGRWFIDNMSRANLPTRSVLRSARDGAIFRDISHADVDALTKTGFVMPEPE